MELVEVYDKVDTVSGADTTTDSEDTPKPKDKMSDLKNRI